ncbi:transmembrane protein, putative [Medicago truncatula]|uniref:Transmembrane protein, putative n=1 Tax=Medicago truncatula TaxID=3880 RepID=A0A072VPC9_MEDTR|nr:transmembrane protein, putative [Medicago truncatula]
MTIFGLCFLYSPVPISAMPPVVAFTLVFMYYMLPMVYSWTTRVVPVIARQIKDSCTWTLGGALIFGYFYIALMLTAIHFLVKFKH